MFSRRTFLQGSALAAVAPTLAFAQDQSKPLMELAAIAARKPPVIWSESSEVAAIAKVVEAFNKTWPDVKVEFIRDTGGNTLAAKVVQEAQAGGSPAAVLTGDSALFAALEQRGLLVKPDWAALGVAKPSIGTPYMVATTAAMGVLVWNKNKVTDAQAPKTIEDLADAKWAGRIGSWIRAPIYASLAKEMGEANVRQLLEKLTANQARLYDSTYRLAQELGTGEIDVGYGLYHATLPAIKAGAPIGMAFPDVVGLSTLYTCVVNKSANPEGGQLLATWLASAEGSKAYEAATGRGNPFIPGTEASRLVAGKKLSEYPVAELPTYVKVLTDFNKLLSSRGAK